jgi:hypothetical protein
MRKLVICHACLSHSALRLELNAGCSDGLKPADKHAIRKMRAVSCDIINLQNHHFWPNRLIFFKPTEKISQLKEENWKNEKYHQKTLHNSGTRNHFERSRISFEKLCTIVYPCTNQHTTLHGMSMNIMESMCTHRCGFQFFVYAWSQFVP